MDKRLKIGTQRPEIEKRVNTDENNSDRPTSNNLRKTADENLNKNESRGAHSTSKHKGQNVLNKKLRKYQEKLIKYCIIFSDKLTNESLKPVKLKKHGN